MHLSTQINRLPPVHGGLNTILIKVLYERCGSWPQKCYDVRYSTGLSYYIGPHSNQTLRIFYVPERWGLWWNENTYISSVKRVTKKFLEVSRCSRAKQRQRNVQKKCAARAKLLFSLIGPIVVFHRSPALPLPLSIKADTPQADHPLLVGAVVDWNLSNDRLLFIEEIHMNNTVAISCSKMQNLKPSSL